MEKVYRFWPCPRWLFIVSFFTFCWGDKFLEMFHLTTIFISLFTLQKFKDTSMGDVCGFNCHLVLASMLKPIFPHQVHIQKRWLCRVLDLNGLGQWSSPHALNYWRNNQIVGAPTCENPWNIFTSLQIVIILINKVIKPYKWTLSQPINNQ
jgi:hypothetical protein